MKPMLASPTDGTNIRYPVLVSPKLDGVRCLIIDGMAMSRSLKPIPNQFVQTLFGKSPLNGLDGELIVGAPAGAGVYQRTVSGVMTAIGQPAITFWVFDDLSLSAGFAKRLNRAEQRIKRVGCARLVNHEYIETEADLLEEERHMLSVGYEGLMLRDPDGPYKLGRSTLREGYLLKLKRFTDAEAKIVGCTQLLTNTNEAKRNALGQLERSSHKAGKVATQQLGAFIVRDTKTDIEFEVGTGFTQKQREDYWRVRAHLLGDLVKYRYQAVGVKEKPRFPVFIGFRDRRDL